MGRMLLVNEQGSMYGKNVNGQCTWDYGWEECYWEIHMGSWMGKKVPCVLTINILPVHTPLFIDQ
jgi:hypothetical protein